MGFFKACLFAFALSQVNGHLAFWNTRNNLHPVQKLFVKPSSDGTTGDLYVAATEENGVKTQWLTDQTVKFLPSAAQPQQQPLTFPSNLVQSLSHDNRQSSTQKRSLVANPVVRYAYALPVPANQGDAPVAQYAYAIPAAAAPTPTKPTDKSPCSKDATNAQNSAALYPYHYFYPQMMSAFTNAMNLLKEVGLSDNVANEIKAQATPSWPTTGAYAYPVQYVMMDPSAWTSTTTTTTTQATPVETELNEEQQDSSTEEIVEDENN